MSPSLPESLNETADAVLSHNNDFAVLVGGEEQGVGHAAFAEQLLGHMQNPEYNNAREGTFQLDMRVRLEQDAGGKHHIVVLGLDLIAFEPDEGSVAQEALTVVQGSPIAAALAVVPSTRPVLQLHRS